MPNYIIDSYSPPTRLEWFIWSIAIRLGFREWVWSKFEKHYTSHAECTITTGTPDYLTDYLTHRIRGNR